MPAERTVPVTFVAALALWVFTFIFIATGTVAGFLAEGQRGLALAFALMVHGLACSAGAATMTIRNGLKDQTRLFKAAFKLGEEAGTLRRVR